MRVILFMKYTLLFCSILFKATAAFTQEMMILPHEKEVTLNVSEIDHFDGPKVQGGCKNIKVVYQDEKASGGCAGVLMRTYHFSDDCGQKASTIVFIHLRDTHAPVFSVKPNDMNVTSKEQIPAVADINATDDSGNEVLLSFSESKEGNKIIRKWTASDDCDNTSQWTQTITIQSN